MRRAVLGVGLVALAVVAAGGGWALGQRGDDESASPTTKAAPASAPPSSPATTAVAPPTTAAPDPAPRVPSFLDLAGWQAIMRSLPSPVSPSDCGLPIDEPESLPNADRSYRGGVHQGIDFICMERGRSAVAALPGRVLLANNTFVDPTPADRVALLDEAQSLGRTPPWTLAMLFGRFIVLDHGVIPGAGHVVSIYAHLNQIDPAIRPGRRIEAGTRLGEIGNRGTEAAGTGEDNPRSIHLHWELHVDDVYLGAGLGAEDTRTLYAELFGVG